MEKAIITAAIIIGASAVAVAMVVSDKEKKDNFWNNSSRNASNLMSDAFWAARCINR